MKRRTAIGFCALATVAAGCSTSAVTSTTLGTAPPTTAELTAPPVTARQATTLEVSIPSSDIELSGTLRLPEATGQVPAAVLIHGSGPVDRDARLPGQVGMVFGFDVPVFAQLADALQDQGFAVLTYDKRSCGPFNGCAQNGYPLPSDDITIDTFLDDAVAAIAWLRQQDAVDPSGITVIGHSQGAQFVPVILEADAQLASGAMIAGPYNPIDAIIEGQRDLVIQLLEQVGTAGEDAASSPSVAPITEIVDGLAAMRLGSEDSVAGATAEFWRSWFELGEASVAAATNVTQELLVLNGEMDWNVPVAEAELWREHLLTFDTAAEVVTLPCITHALNCVSESDPTAMTPSDFGRSVAPEVIAALVTFLQQASVQG